LCGDAHLSNFGLFASPERDLVFDLNDFDETLPGPFEWDVKRLAASVVVAGRHVGVKDKRARAAAAAAVASYRTTMRTLSGLGPLQVWYARVDVEPLVRRLKGTSLATGARKAQRASLGGTGEVATAKLTKVVDGQRRFRNRPPLLVAVDDEHYPGAFGHAAELYRGYLATLSPEQLILLRQYAVTGLAHKVVGVGSVGTRALVLLLESGDRDVLLLQVKQANESVLAHHLGSSEYENQGRRVVVGQRLMQAAGDPLLGWARRSEQAPYDFYVRQLKDMKGSFDLDSLHGADLELYARICGAVLARAHARAGDAAAIRGYLGSSTAFDGAVTAWALEYADRTEADHGALVETLRRDPAEQGVRPA
ncbi:MAG: DUF2252 domain-containing protein, partial [Dermatophilaceae bacterium]